MSWVSGIQLKETSWSLNLPTAVAPLVLATRLRVRQHHALRLAGRAGGELDEGQIIRRRAGAACRAAICR